MIWFLIAVCFVCGLIFLASIFYYGAKYEYQIELAKIEKGIKEETTKIKNVTIFSWIFVLSAFAIIWIEQYRNQLIATLFLSLLFGYISIKEDENKES